MAVRSGAGTGVVVSLVVFILTTIFLLILTIVFYSGQTKAKEATNDADRALGVFVKSGERNREPFKSFEATAQSNGDSVVGYLHGQMQSVMEFVDGAPSTSIDEMRNAFRRLDVAEGDVIRVKLDDTKQMLSDSETETDGLKAQLKGEQDQNAELLSQIEQLRGAMRDQTDRIEGEIVEYRDAADEYRRELDDAVTDYNDRVDRMIIGYDENVGDLQDEVDQLSSERVALIRRVDELESKVRQSQLAGQSPELLVDGRIIDSVGSNEQVFIDRGRRHHIVLGMTFEVYDNASSLQQIDKRTGQLPRGKGSLEVIKVGETTSTCKITRSVPGRPVVREDVIANAVYDPRYQFKFLVHGKFDVDSDGRPTEAEAEYIRSLIIDWGGTIITGETLPGDLDFLVLGVEPPQPLRLKANAKPHETQVWLQKRQAYETYQDLMRQASRSQIPLLNANRFFILTGYSRR